MECVTNRPFGHDPNTKHQATVNMIARSGACARARAQARGWAPAPLPARMAMALAPLLNFLSTILKTRYDFGINSVDTINFLSTILKTRYTFGINSVDTINQ
jgi:hypothetical protein